MAVVVVDERGRLTVPSELHVRHEGGVDLCRAFLIIVPIPSQPLVASASWLRTKRSNRELKALAEKQARKDAVKRARRRRQA